jgi:hypothetical protein
LEISRPGYTFLPGKQEIQILPGSKPFLVKEKLFAKARPLSFEMTFESKLIKAIEVLLDGKQVKAEDLFKPGQEYSLTAKFEEYKTANRRINIPPGEGPFVVDLQLVKLHKFEIRVAKQYYETSFGMVLDNIRYTLELYVDNEQVEAHHIHREGGINLIYANFYALKHIRNMKISCGFYYDDGVASSTQPVTFRDLRKIDGTLLSEHLRELAKNNPSNALKRMETILEDPQDKAKISSLSREDREKLVNLLRDLELRDKSQQETRNELIKKLS